MILSPFVVIDEKIYLTTLLVHRTYPKFPEAKYHENTCLVHIIEYVDCCVSVIYGGFNQFRVLEIRRNKEILMVANILYSEKLSRISRILAFFCIIKTPYSHKICKRISKFSEISLFAKDYIAKYYQYLYSRQFIQNISRIFHLVINLSTIRILLQIKISLT